MEEEKAFKISRPQEAFWGRMVNWKEVSSV
jgi:hypothetical protein